MRAISAVGPSCEDPSPGGPRSVPRPAGRLRRHARSNLVVGAWLLAALGVSLVHPFLPDAPWLLVHLLLLGAVSSAVTIWSTHFATTLLRAPDPRCAWAFPLRLAGLNLGAIAVVTGVVTDRLAVVAAGGSAVAAAAVLHAFALGRTARGTLPSRFGIVVRYYVTAALMLPVGAGLGVLLARSDLDDHLEARLRLAHEALNVLGWLGLTVVGTLVTFWPTVLRTRLADGAEASARRALPLLLGGVTLTTGAALVGPPVTAVAGIACYLTGLVMAGRPMIAAARGRRPSSVAAWSLAAGSGWLLVSLATLAALLAGSRDWATAGERLAVLTAPLAVGWIAQTLFGALTYLVPVLVGGGPRAARATGAALERGGPARVTALNAALAVAVLPVPSLVRVLCASIVLALLVVHTVLLVRTVRHGQALRREGEHDVPETASRAPAPSPVSRRAGVAAGIAVVVVAVAVGGAIDPSGLPVIAAAGAEGIAAAVPETGRTTTVTVEAKGMRFSPSRIDVPVGDRLVVVLRNADDDRHDLVLSNGTRTPRIGPGQTRTLEAGVIGADLDGWCSVVGHRQMGMVLTVRALGAPAAAGAGRHATMPHAATPHDAGRTAGAPAASLDPMATPPPSFTAWDARLKPLPAANGPQVYRRTITVREVDREVAPGVRQRAWTFDGTVPGPTLHGRVGDTFEVTLVNGGSIGHSIDFHAGALAPGPVMRTIQPGQSLAYRFTATRSGIWMYHCSTMPMSLHIANGMFGAVVIDPPGLAPAAREYVLIQSETYLGAPGETADVGKLRSVQPDAVVFNGYPGQYAAHPLVATVGERVRIWVLAAGPNVGTSFHVVGGQFDTLYAEGAYRLRPGDPATGGAQVLGLGPAEGGFVEIAFPEPGTYPVVSHRMVDAERGARGAVLVSATPRTMTPPAATPPAATPPAATPPAATPAAASPPHG